MLRPDPDCFFSTILFSRANENQSLPGDRKSFRLLEIAIRCSVGRNWQETLALLFQLPRFMGFRVHEKEGEGGGRALIIANVNYLFTRSFLCIREVNREEIHLGKED